MTVTFSQALKPIGKFVLLKKVVVEKTIIEKSNNTFFAFVNFALIQTKLKAKPNNLIKVFPHFKYESFKSHERFVPYHQ